MKYRESADGIFLDRPNRFIAHVDAVSLGGDSDTLACITGGIAEAFYGMPQKLRAETLKRLPEDLRAAPFRAGAFLQGESVVY